LKLYAPTSDTKVVFFNTPLVSFQAPLMRQVELPTFSISAKIVSPSFFETCNVFRVPGQILWAARPAPKVPLIIKLTALSLISPGEYWLMD
jgi:hypothetical protein